MEMTCEGCGSKFINVFDSKPVCMECVKARAKTACSNGRCKCGAKKVPGEPAGPGVGKRSGRVFIPCKRCLGSIKQVQ